VIVAVTSRARWQLRARENLNAIAKV